MYDLNPKSRRPVAKPRGLQTSYLHAAKGSTGSFKPAQHHHRDSRPHPPLDPSSAGAGSSSSAPPPSTASTGLRASSSAGLWGLPGGSSSSSGGQSRGGDEFSFRTRWEDRAIGSDDDDDWGGSGGAVVAAPSAMSRSFGNPPGSAPASSSGGVFSASSLGTGSRGAGRASLKRAVAAQGGLHQWSTAASSSFGNIKGAGSSTSGLCCSKVKLCPSWKEFHDSCE